MRLFIAEKPELARAIANGIGGNWQKTKTHMTNGSDTVTWCFGHMIELADPEDYDPKFAKWNMADLPFYHLPVKYKITADKKEQVKAIKELVAKSSLIVNAGDPDEEGQLLIDELLRYFGNNKPVMRVLINDNTPAVVQKALANLKPNSDYEHMGWKAEARRIADQLFGYNLSRAYTLSNQAGGGGSTISIGRVQTPILGMVVRRDRLNASHKKSYYYHVTADNTIHGVTFKAKYIAAASDPVDEKGKLIDKGFADSIAEKCTGKPVRIKKIATKSKETPPPLPFNLLVLQQQASKKWGYKPDKVMKITQSLREKHQLITYNRSDCQYLSDEQHADAANVLRAISQTMPSSADMAKNANLNIKGKAFDSSKVSAHHGIIPTQGTASWDSLSQEEKNLYEIIARRYMLQFYPNYQYDETKLFLEIEGHYFGLTATVQTAAGWKAAGIDDDEDADEDKPQEVDLRGLGANMQGQCNNAVTTEHETKPPALYTISTLMGDLARAAKYIKDPRLAKLLKEKDEDKAGEHGGIGTSATRSAIINGLFERGFIAEKGKNVVSTQLGQDLYDTASDLIKYPDMSAIWFEQQKSIHGADDVEQFIKIMMEDVVNHEVERIRNTSFKSSQSYPCPKCSRPLVRRKGKFGVYWQCSGVRDEANPCNHTMNDKGGKPIEKQAMPAPVATDFDCQCGTKLVKKTGISKTKKSWTRYDCPSCKNSYWDKNGVPNYED